MAPQPPAPYNESPGPGSVQPAPSSPGGLPKWYLRRSSSTNHKYGLDKDDELRKHAAPKLDCSIPAPKYKFYVYPLEIPRRCNLHKKNLNSEMFTKMLAHSQWLDETFFYHQMLDHPWRTHDPSEAFLFYVPILSTLSANWKCGSWEGNMMHVQEALQNSTWYQRHQGADHLMFSTTWKMRKYMANNPSFAHLVRNFIVGRQLYWVSEFPDQCSIGMPHSSQMAVKGKCGYRRAEGSTEANVLFCKSAVADHIETTFEEYMQRRNYTLFCMGQADDRPSHTSRRLAIDNLSLLYPPNFLVGVGTKPQAGRPTCEGDQVNRFKPIPAASPLEAACISFLSYPNPIQSQPVAYRAERRIQCLMPHFFQCQGIVQSFQQSLWMASLAQLARGNILVSMDRSAEGLCC